MKPAFATTAVIVLLAGCGARSNKLEYGHVDSEKLGRQMELAVLRAPELPGVDPGELPVIVLLHGMGDDHRSLDRFGLSDHLHAAMRTGRLPPAHFVAPHGERGFYFNWYDGSRPYEDYILEEVIPAGEALLGVSPARERRHVIGVSMGATGAINIGLKHPEKFASVTCLSGLIMNQEQAEAMRDNLLLRMLVDVEAVWGDGTDPEFSDAHDPYLLVAGLPEEYPQKLYVAYGSDEGRRFEETSGRFHDHLDALGVEHRFQIYDGGHGWKHWAPVIEEALRYALDGSI